MHCFGQRDTTIYKCKLEQSPTIDQRQTFIGRSTSFLSIYVRFEVNLRQVKLSWYFRFSLILHFSIRQWTEETNHTSSKLYREICLSDESNVNYTGRITLVIVKYYDICLCSKYISMSSIHIVRMIHYTRKILVSFMISSKYQHQSCEEHYRNLSDKKKNSYIPSTVSNYLSLGK